MQHEGEGEPGDDGAAGTYSAARQPNELIAHATVSGTSAAPAFWQVKERVPGAAGRRVGELWRRKTCTLPADRPRRAIEAHRSAIAGSTSVAETSTLIPAAARRPKTGACAASARQ